LYSSVSKTKPEPAGYIDMISNDKDQKASSVEGQDFADPKEEGKDKPFSHGEVANQQGSDFSDLEESRMENPPQHRDENGSTKDDVDSSTKIDQSKGVN